MPTMISPNVANTISVCFMGAIGFTALALIANYWQRRNGSA